MDDAGIGGSAQEYFFAWQRHAHPVRGVRLLRFGCNFDDLGKRCHETHEDASALNQCKMFLYIYIYICVSVYIYIYVSLYLSVRQ